MNYKLISLVAAESTLTGAHGAYKPEHFASNVSLGSQLPLSTITNLAEAVVVHSLKILENGEMGD